MSNSALTGSYSEAKGFIHERIIYEYMKYRVKYGALKMNLIVKLGKLNAKPELVNVDELTIVNTKFPDVDKLVVSNNRSREKQTRVAEIKFLTSEFDYHKQPRFNKFINDNGCIIVLKHDSLPFGLEAIDVYELDREDFKSYVRENFDRLLSSQILSRDHEDYKIWLFSQSPNFYMKRNGIPSAKETCIWCPTKTMTQYDLAKKDKVIFIKFGGAERLKQKVNNYIKHEDVYPDWYIKQLWIGEITVPVKERKEYCLLKSYDYTKPLWPNEKNSSKLWPWVFEFINTDVINCNINCKKLYSYFDKLVNPILYEVFFQQVAREISQAEYIRFIEYVASEQNTQLQATLNMHRESNIKDFLARIITTPNILQETKTWLDDIEKNILH